MTTAATRPARKRRPMIEMTGTVAALQPHDYVDMIGGEGFKAYRVGALVHSIDDTKVGLTTGKPGRVIEFMGIKLGNIGFDPACPVKFRRFADA